MFFELTLGVVNETVVVAVLKTVVFWVAALLFRTLVVNVVHFVLTEVVILVVVFNVVTRVVGLTVDVFTVVATFVVTAAFFIGMFGQVAVGVHGDDSAMHCA
jgi:hypothetical protein